MDRYSGRESVLHAGTYVAPFVPFMFLSAMYSRRLYYQASLLDLSILWLVGLLLGYGSIFVHEMGHVIAARLVDIRIASITIGHWRKLRSFYIGSMVLTLRAAPASGYVVPELSAHLLSVPRVVPFLLAGVIAQGVAVGLIVIWVPLPESIVSFSDLLFVFCYVDIVFIGGFYALLNLWPYEGWVGGEKLPSDGMQLLRLWTDRHQKPAQRQLLAEYQKLTALLNAKEYVPAVELAERLAKDQPANFELAQLVGTLCRECGNLEKAEAIWRDLLKQPIGTSAFAASVLDSLACLPLYHGKMELLGEAEAWANTAIQYAPNAITLKGTQGSILIELGRIDEGIEMLLQVAKRTECQTDQVICAAYLSKAYAAKGNHSEAQQWMDKARKIEPDHLVVKRVEKEYASLAKR